MPYPYLTYAYELTSSTRTASGRPVGSAQDEMGALLLHKLRPIMLAAMRDAGWVSVATTREGQSIYQCKPELRFLREATETKPSLSEPEGEQENTPPALPLVAAAQEQPQPVPAQRSISNQMAGRTAQTPRQQVIVRTTRPRTFVCQWCHEEVTEQRYPSHTPLYCSKPECKQEATRIKTRERVAKHRRLHPDARKQTKL